MTEPITGSQILQGLKDARDFFKQISLLMKTSEELIQNKGWNALFGNKCADLSAHLSRPEKWLPREVYRFFISDEDNEKNKDLILYVGILLEDEESRSRFQEPWITCGVFKYDTELFDVKKFSDWEFVWTYLNEYELEADGHFEDEDCNQDENNDAPEFLFQTTMALPLTAIDSADKLEELVIDPLLRKVPELDEIG